MKKITLFLLLTMFAFQGYSQSGVAAIVEDTKYTLRNIGTGEYLKANGSGQYEFAATLPTNDVTFNFFFNHHDTIDPGADGMLGTADDVVHDYPDDWNIGNDVRGIMRSNNTGTVHTNFKYNQWNANGGHKTDKRWVESTLVQGPFNTFRFGALVSGTDVRYLYHGVDGVLYNFTVTDMNDAANAATDGEARSYWFLEESSIVLSNDKFDTSSIFISNPVNNEISIKGLTSNVKEVSVYSLLGQKMITEEVNAESSLTMDASSLSSGMYLVEMKGDNGSFTKKIVKQ
jgi:hypothetical protein